LKMKEMLTCMQLEQKDVRNKYSSLSKNNKIKAFTTFAQK
jgi:hypothetical protein